MWIFHQFVDACCEIARELFGVCCFEWAFVQSVQRNEKASFTVNDNFLDAAHGTGHNRSFAGHRFKIDDAERLVDRWTNEYSGLRVKFAGRLLVDHFVDPDDSPSLRFCPFDRVLHFFGHAGCIRRGGAKHNLEIAIHELHCAYQMLEPFLPSDPTDKQQIRFVGIDAVPLKCSD